jgi:hypothetical protein
MESPLAERFAVAPTTSSALQGFEVLAQSDVALRFVAAVIRRSTLSWLPEGRAESVQAALVEGLRQAATISDWPEERPRSAGESSTTVELSTDTQQFLRELLWALKAVQADPKLLAHVSGEPAKLARGMSVYASRADLSLDATPW